MSRILNKIHNMKRRKNRVRATVYGTAERPRLNVYVSNRHINAQIIDDTQHKTFVYVSTVGQKSTGSNMTEKATWVGTEIAKKAKAAKITTVTFDRGSKLYHGRVKALADAARAGGLEF